MNDAPSIAIVSGGSSAPSNTGSPVLLSKSATRIDTGSIGLGGGAGVVLLTTTVARPIIATTVAAAAAIRHGDTTLGTGRKWPSSSSAAMARARSLLV